jgi:hypothetical protein
MMSTYPFLSHPYLLAFAVTVGAVIAILVADLAISRMRGVPFRALFIAVHIALIFGYLAWGSMLVIGPVMLTLPIALLAFLVAYLALGTAQVAALAAGLKERGTVGPGAVLVALLLGYLPVIGGIAAVRGAIVGWRWTAARGLARFLGPLAAIAAPLLLG